MADVPVSTSGQLDLADVQQVVLSGRDAPSQAAVFLELTDTTLSRAWLRVAAGGVTPAGHRSAPGEPGASGRTGAGSVGLALSAWGLQALGVPHRELAAMPGWFREGIVAWSGVLGFTGAGAPHRWRVSFRRIEPDAVLLIGASTTAALHELTADWLADLGAYGVLVVDRLLVTAPARPDDDEPGPPVDLGARVLADVPPPLPSWTVHGSFLQLVWRAPAQPDRRVGEALELSFSADIERVPPSAGIPDGSRVVAAGAYLVPSISALRRFAELDTVA